MNTREVSIYIYIRVVNCSKALKQVGNPKKKRKKKEKKAGN